MSRRPRALATGWVFDLDGTLTLPSHDYAAIKAALGLPAHLPLLEGIATRPDVDRPRLIAEVHAWEVRHAAQAQVRPGAEALLDALGAAGVPVGLLTRNTRSSALHTLDVTGLARHFRPDRVIGRDDAAPKPAPDGVHLAAARLGLAAADVAVIGDFRFDLDAARAAGALAVWLDAERTGAHAHLADLVVHELSALLA